MDNATVAIIIIVIFALIVVTAFLVFRQRASLKIKGPLGTGLKLDSSNDPPTPGITIKDVKSESGVLIADDQTGRGVTVKDVDVANDILLSHSRNTKLESESPKSSSLGVQSGQSIQAENIKAGRDVNIIIAPVPSPLRLDAAVPDKVALEQAFDLAIAIRQMDSLVLNENDLSTVKSGEVQVLWSESQPFVHLRVQISAPDCEIHGEDSYSFRLYSGRDSPIFYFHLTPKKPGTISIIVKVYQEDDWLGSTRIHTTAYEQMVGSVQIEVTSHRLISDENSDEDVRIMFTPEQQAAWIILQKAFTLVTNELKQRWQFAREKKANAAKISRDEQTQPNVSMPLQTALKTELESIRDTTQLRIITDDLETAITMAEKYNRRRNKYRKQLPDSIDPVPIEIQIEKAETERDKAIVEIKETFETIAKEEVAIENAG